jgi:GDP-L-fucose synthase
MNLDKSIYETHTKAMQTHINVGCGEDVSIADLARLVAKTIGYEGQINFDISKPDGSPRKLMDSSLLMSLGWKPNIGLEMGLAQTYEDFLMHVGVL